MEDKESALVGALLEQRYRVDAPLARGGMSAVYRGVDTRLDRPVAIKVMDSRFADDKTFVERFEREARSAARIHHPNVVAVHDQGLDGDHVYLVMELVSGGTLRDLLAERTTLPVPLAVAIMEPVLSALAAAHRAGLIHRDVKPENVLIGTGGIVKVADFGLVRAISSVGTTKSSVILGTVAYLSPEQVTTGAATARGDVYSAGIVLYEALTGSPPYHGDNALSVAYRHVNDDVPPPSATVPGIPPMLDELVVRATRRDPAARPADGAAFLAELQQVRAALSLPRMRVPIPQAAPVDETIAVSGAVSRAVSGPTHAAVEEVNALDPEETVKVPLAAITSAEATVKTQQPQVQAQPTVMRPVPGFSAAGPQGTRAMLRSDLDRVIDSAAAQAGPPSTPFPAPAAPPPPAPNPKRRLVLLSVVGVLVIGLLATAIWWFSAGRYTEVPTLAGKDSETAQQLIRSADLNPNVTTVRDNDVEAGVVISSDPKAGAEALRGDQVNLVISAGKPVVPDVRPGASRDEAERAIGAEELQAAVDDSRNVHDEQVPAGRVVKLDPPSGTRMQLNERVVIVLSKGPAPKEVPDVRGKTRDEAFQALTQAGFEPVDGPQEFSADVESGRVVRTDPGAGAKIEASAAKRVSVVVSSAVTVPDLSQRPVAEAQAMLQQLGLTLELQPFSNPNGRVFSQGPPAGTKVRKGDKVTVFAW
ncbi:serine/threonine-protein kinase [Actinokineospora baliensis]|uniref:Stk1 family PASTA domain-containing Ser/Thr kinase n=1 Tax=Actinokineospora baliensis TaxID=547056 RepID=UPI0027DCF6D1|nr:Stk1 family PASTA domain-containing Ser/Thr kinase [Actinokineospora baliensis]MBM7776408.1 serine/threonine-protein kinase [Actinokineospora baliensis]